jgi:hypothetical protein
MRETEPQLRVWLAWGVLAAAVGLAWMNGLHGEFTYDDKVEVIGNRTIRVLENWRALLGYNLSRPILISTYAVNHHFSGTQPLLYHLVDVVLQAVNAGLAMVFVAQLVEHLGGKRPLRVGVIAAALWALHPLSTEAVTYVTGRSEQLVATFALASCWGWMRWLKGGSWETWGWCWLGAVAAGLTKENGVMVPVAFVVLEWGVVRGSLRKVRWWTYFPGAVLVLAFFGFRYHHYGVFTTPHDLRPLDVQLWTQAEVVLRYLGLVVWPAGQTVFHDHPETGMTLRSFACAGVLVGATAAAWVFRRKAPLWSVAWFWFLLALLPSSSVVPLKETMAEHRAYLAFLGPCWVAALCISRLSPPRDTGVAVGLAALLLVATHRRNEVWATEVSLWAEVVERSPGSADGWYGYGEAQRFTLVRHQEEETSRQVLSPADAYRRATELDPNYLDAWNNLGLSEANRGSDEEAIAAWREALKRSPTYCKAHNNLGLLHARRDRYPEAAAEFQAGLLYCPENPLGLYLLGKLYDEQLEEPDKAVLAWQALLEVDPEFGQAEEVRQRILELTW